MIEMRKAGKVRRHGGGLPAPSPKIDGDRQRTAGRALRDADGSARGLLPNHHRGHSRARFREIIPSPPSPPPTSAAARRRGGTRVRTDGQFARNAPELPPADMISPPIRVEKVDER